MHDMNYYELGLHFSSTEKERWNEYSTFLFDDFGCLGVQELNIDEDEIESTPEFQKLWAGLMSLEDLEIIEKKLEKKICHYKLFFQNIEMAKGFLEFLSSQKFYCDFKIEEEMEKDWNAEWRKHFQGVSVGDEFQILPPWERDKDVSIDTIYINPGMGFGTGEHETTFLCLEYFLEIREKKNLKILDLGCGSGILGISALYYNAREVHFVDIDLDALENCKENLNENNYDSYVSDVVPEQKYNLIFANILLPVLIEKKNFFWNKLENGGRIILSGILLEQVPEIKDHFKKFKLISTKEKGPWAAILFEKEGH